MTINLGVIDGITGLVSEFIEDKDKIAQINAEVEKAKLALEIELLKNKTIPFVDALVKIQLAFEPMWRPLGSFLMTCFGAYCHAKGVELNDVILGIFDGAFPTWMGLREGGKHRKQKSEERVAFEKEKTKQIRKSQDPYDYDDDEF